MVGKIKEKDFLFLVYRKFGCRKINLPKVWKEIPHTLNINDLTDENFYNNNRKPLFV